MTTEPTHSVPAVEAPSRPRVRALVVDDEPSLVRVVAGYLTRKGYAVDTAADGESAGALARTMLRTSSSST